MMASQLVSRPASTVKSFEQVWRALPEYMRLALSQKGLNGCRFWARLVDGEDEPQEVVMDTMQGLCGDLHSEAGDPDELGWVGYLVPLMSLTKSAQAPAERSESRVARTTDLQIAIGFAERKRQREESLESREHSRLQVYAPPTQGREWRPIKYVSARCGRQA